MTEPQALDARRRGLLLAVSLLRFGLLVWATIVVVVDVTGTTPVRPVIAAVLLGALATWTAVLAWWLRSRPDAVTRSWVLAVDLGLAMTVAAADHVVYTGEHPQTFASAWPMSAAVVAGVLRGPGVGAGAGVAIGLAGALGTAAARDGGLGGRWVATIGTAVLLTLAGALAGALSSLLRDAEMATARAQAREEVARRLHDGVLQTLAVVQRRSQDPELVRLARDQELDLRSYLAEVPDPTTGARRADPVTTVRAALSEVERRTGVRCELIVIEFPDRLDRGSIDALTGAIGEAVVNADKHGGARTATVCLDVDDEGHPVCTVNDDGTGFDVARTSEGLGLRRSIRGRFDDLGGRVEVSSTAGHGCEVRLVLPRPRSPRP
jgi:signal transduction histidine kinase